MRLRLSLMLALTFLAGCEVAVPNGLFGCGQQSDCPSGYYCWSSDSRCYDAPEPQCEPKSCDQVLAEFASLGIEIECGSLPDGCEGSIECGGCPEGSVCGANGQSFACGCEENTCASVDGGVECGLVPRRCGDVEEAIFCGNCFGEEVCQENRCVCPSGVNCDDGCEGRCGPGEVCVEGECCEPLYPCSQNECSPPGGLPDGCGGVANCPPCAGEGESCVLSDELIYECVGDCTCEAQGVECGSATICGSPKLCGTCEDNGFGEGFRCQSGRCVCEDPFEYNDDFDNFSLICGEGTGISCDQPAWGVEVQATFHHEEDIDLYALQVLDSDTSLFAHVNAQFGSSDEQYVYMAYICPDGQDGIEFCFGPQDEIDGITFCTSDGESVGLVRRCEPQGPFGLGTVLVGIEPKDFNQCNPYELTILATYTPEPPGGLDPSTF